MHTGHNHTHSDGTAQPGLGMLRCYEGASSMAAGTTAVHVWTAAHDRACTGPRPCNRAAPGCAGRGRPRAARSAPGARTARCCVGGPCPPAAQEVVAPPWKGRRCLLLADAGVRTLQQFAVRCLSLGAHNASAAGSQLRHVPCFEAPLLPWQRASTVGRWPVTPCH